MRDEELLLFWSLIRSRDSEAQTGIQSTVSYAQYYIQSPVAQKKIYPFGLLNKTK